MDLLRAYLRPTVKAAQETSPAVQVLVVVLVVVLLAPFLQEGSWRWLSVAPKST